MSSRSGKNPKGKELQDELEKDHEAQAIWKEIDEQLAKSALDNEQKKTHKTKKEKKTKKDKKHKSKSKTEHRRQKKQKKDKAHSSDDDHESQDAAEAQPEKSDLMEATPQAASSIGEQADQAAEGVIVPFNAESPELADTKTKATAKSLAKAKAKPRARSKAQASPKAQGKAKARAKAKACGKPTAKASPKPKPKAKAAQAKPKPTALGRGRGRGAKAQAQAAAAVAAATDDATAEALEASKKGASKRPHEATMNVSYCNCNATALYVSLFIDLSIYLSTVSIYLYLSTVSIYLWQTSLLESQRHYLSMDLHRCQALASTLSASDASGKKQRALTLAELMERQKQSTQSAADIS